jgi:hypothetical protein
MGKGFDTPKVFQTLGKNKTAKEKRKAQIRLGKGGLGGSLALNDFCTFELLRFAPSR